jgi:hypothetical protein
MLERARRGRRLDRCLHGPGLADTHQQARHEPSEFRTIESYRPQIAEVDEQFRLFLEAGYTIPIWRREGQPYQDTGNAGGCSQ